MRSIGKFFVFLLILLFSVAMLLTYFGGENKKGAPNAGNSDLFMDLTEERLLGGQMQEYVIEQFGGLSADVKANAILMSVGKKILKSKSVDDAPWDFSFYLLKDTVTPHLQANPDGSVLITQGLYNLLATEDQLAALLCHGMGHILSRHTVRNLQDLKNAGTLDVPALRDMVEGAGKQSLTEQFATVLCEHTGSAAEEVEADQLARILLQECGYDPQALREAFLVLRSHQVAHGKLKILELHPMHAQRMEQLNR